MNGLPAPADPGRPGTRISPASNAVARGFTLIELIIVIVLIGTLAIFAVPRMVDTTMWRLKTFGDDLQGQMQSMLRLSLAQRREVVASISPTGVSFAYAAGVALPGLACPVTISNCIAETRSVNFNAANSGRVTTSTGSALTITVNSGSYSQAYQIEAETGLMRSVP